MSVESEVKDAGMTWKHADESGPKQCAGEALLRPYAPLGVYRNKSSQDIHFPASKSTSTAFF
ncbi:hypothetical protein DPMN_026735 [Dreissena polymorpha]|uniref:Uncharacterized protein n=1 Tax=Dreissena polymorpha TaxID=45954 RepID=A0A9D4LRQ0_DREPO|nr:hypothetical protein DPMN_026735 [Dreissena polymorpha]